MNLVIDFGNTLVKVAVFQEGDIVHFEAHPKFTVKKMRDILKKYRISAAIVSSVVNDSGPIEAFLKKSYHFVKLNPATSLPIRNHYETPGSLGMDRLAGMCGAGLMMPGRNVLVVNAGTCITYDVVTSKSEYFGGNITPGLEMRLKALNTFTDRLPLVRKQFSSDLFGKSTTASILTGVVRGSYLEMNGFISEYRKMYKSLKVILTGGDAPIFETMTKSKIFAVPNLVLYGLNKILTLNEPNQ